MGLVIRREDAAIGAPEELTLDLGPPCGATGFIGRAGSYRIGTPVGARVVDEPVHPLPEQEALVGIVLFLTLFHR